MDKRYFMRSFEYVFLVWIYEMRSVLITTGIWFIRIWNFFNSTLNYKISIQISSVQWVLNLEQRDLLHITETTESVTGSKCLHILHRRSNPTGHRMRTPCIFKKAVPLYVGLPGLTYEDSLSIIPTNALVYQVLI